MQGTGYNIPISFANASAVDTNLGLNTYVDFGDGGIFAPTYGGPTDSQSTSATAAEGNAASATAAGAAGPLGLPSTTGGISTSFLLIIAGGVAAFWLLRKKL